VPRDTTQGLREGWNPSRKDPFPLAVTTKRSFVPLREATNAIVSLRATQPAEAASVTTHATARRTIRALIEDI